MGAPGEIDLGRFSEPLCLRGSFFSGTPETTCLSTMQHLRKMRCQQLSRRAVTAAVRMRNEGSSSEDEGSDGEAAALAGAEPLVLE